MNRTNDDCMFINRYHNNAKPVAVYDVDIGHKYRTSAFTGHYHIDDFIMTGTSHIAHGARSMIIQEINNNPLLDSCSKMDIEMLLE